MKTSYLFVCSIFLMAIIALSAAQSTTTSSSTASSIMVQLNKDLYPPEIYSKKIPLGSQKTIDSVNLFTDWWMKRPTEIRIYNLINGEKGDLLTLKQFNSYDNMICGDSYDDNFDEKCEYPAKPIARLVVPLGESVTGVVVEIEGLLSSANFYAMLKVLQLLGN